MSKIEPLEVTGEPSVPNGTVFPHDAAGLREYIRASRKRRTGKLVEVPEWECSVLVQAMSGQQRRLFEALPRTDKGQLIDPWHCAFLLMCWCTVHPETRETLFDANDRELEREMLSEHDAAIIDRLATEAIDVSRITQPQMEQARKNSETTPTSSTTDG